MIKRTEKSRNWYKSNVRGNGKRFSQLSNERVWQSLGGGWRAKQERNLAQWDRAEARGDDYFNPDGLQTQIRPPDEAKWRCQSDWHPNGWQPRWAHLEASPHSKQLDKSLILLGEEMSGERKQKEGRHLSWKWQEAKDELKINGKCWGKKKKEDWSQDEWKAAVQLWLLAKHYSLL